MDEILSGKNREEVIENIHNMLRTKAEDVRNGRVDIKKFVITKSLTKAPEDYVDSRNQPHVQVALKLKAAGKSIKPGDFIPYVICKSSSTLLAEKAFSPELLNKGDDSPVLDIEWYLQQQILPPATRLCDGVPGGEASQLADCLGVTYNAPQIIAPTQPSITWHVDKEERFQNLKPINFPCPGCKKMVSISASTTLPSSCSHCQRGFGFEFLKNQLTLFKRNLIGQYYNSYFVCDEPSCKQKSRQFIFKKTPKCTVPGCRGSMQPEVNALFLNDSSC